MKAPRILNKITDIVLNYRPQAKQKSPRQRKKSAMMQELCEHGLPKQDCNAHIPCLVCGKERAKCNHYDGDLRKERE